MPDEESAIQDASARDTAVQAPETPAYQPIEEGDEWLEEPAELPPRPRRRIFAPVPLALIGVLLVACGFIAGVLIEKGQTSSGTSAGAAGGLGSPFAALRRDAGGATGSSGASGPAGGAGGPGGGAGATTGSVAYVSGETLYLTTSEGNTVKVTTSAGTTVTKTVSAAVKGIHPGETVAVVGPAGANGAISAESIRVGGGGFGALFGRPGSGGGSSRGGAGSTGGGSSGSQALFGNGG